MVEVVEVVVVGGGWWWLVVVVVGGGGGGGGSSDAPSITTLHINLYQSSNYIITPGVSISCKIFYSLMQYFNFFHLITPKVIAKHHHWKCLFG